MASYRWTCNACGSGNEPQVEYCEKCNCSATAGAEEIEKHKNPEAFRKKKNYKIYESYMAVIVSIPFFIVLYSVNRSYEVLLFLVASAFISGIIQFKLIVFMWNTIWARFTIITSSILLVLILLIRMFFIEDESHLVWLIVVLNTVIMTFTYYSLLKSRRGKLLFEAYYSMKAKDK